MTIIKRVYAERMERFRDFPAERLRVFVGKAETKEINAVLNAKLKASPLPAGSAFGMEWYCTEAPSELRVEAKQ